MEIITIFHPPELKTMTGTANQDSKYQHSQTMIYLSGMGKVHTASHGLGVSHQTLSDTRRRVPPCIIAWLSTVQTGDRLYATERTPFSPLWVGGPSPVSTLSQNSHNEMHIEQKVSLIGLVCSTSKPGC